MGPEHSGELLQKNSDMVDHAIMILAWGRGGTLYDGPHREALAKRGTFFRLQVQKRYAGVPPWIFGPLACPQSDRGTSTGNKTKCMLAN